MLNKNHESSHFILTTDPVGTLKGYKFDSCPV